MQKRWLVRPEDGARTVGDVVRLAGGDARAVDEGRVFVGRRRAQAEGELVKAGDEVSIAAPAEAVPDVRILARTSDLVVADKPAGIPTIPDHAGGAGSLVALVARAIGVDAARLHPTSRLDRDVSGVVTLALSPRAAERLLAARARGAYARRYVAIATRAPEPDTGAWDAPIGRAKDPRRREAFGKDAVPARTLYRVVARAGPFAMLALAPVTGRTHQLRVHAAHAGAPLAFDRAYGAPPRVTLPTGKVLALGRVALHCARVEVPGLRAESPVPDELRALWLSLGGDVGAWDIAVTCTLDASASP